MMGWDQITMVGVGLSVKARREEKVSELAFERLLWRCHLKGSSIGPSVFLRNPLLTLLACYQSPKATLIFTQGNIFFGDFIF